MQSSRSRIALVALGLLVTMNGPGFFLQFRVFEHPWDWEGPVVRELLVVLTVVAVAAVAFPIVDGASVVRSLDRRALYAVGAFTAWIVATSLWSVEPDLTRARSVIYIGLACFAVILAGMSFDERRLALVVAVGFVLTASFVAVLVSDSIGLDRNDDWRGIFTNRNSLAPLAGVGLLLGIGGAVERHGRARWGPAALAVLSAVLMLGSGSRTAWLAVFAAASVALVVVGTRVAHGRVGGRAFGLGGAVAAVGVGVVALVVGTMWSESTFAQRRTIWRLVWEQIGERPVHGHGWFTMWKQPEFTSGHELLGRGSAHDSFLDVWLGAGVVGAIGFLAVVGLALWGALRAAWVHPSPRTAAWLALVSFLVIENLTESFVLWFSYNWVLLMCAALIAVPRSPAAIDPGTREANEAVSA